MINNCWLRTLLPSDFELSVEPPRTRPLGNLGDLVRIGGEPPVGESDDPLATRGVVPGSDDDGEGTGGNGGESKFAVLGVRYPFPVEGRLRSGSTSEW